MKTAKAAKGERRAHREAKDRRRHDEGFTMQVLGGTMEAELYDRVSSAMSRLDPNAPWSEVAPLILPVLKRVHHPYPAGATPIHIQVPPGIPTGFGIDVGPAFSHVHQQLIERWGVDHATLLGTAIENLRGRIVDDPPQVQRFRHEGVDVVGISGQGWGSSLLLLPEAIRPILGDTPRVLLAPIRNTILALPDDVEADAAVFLWDALSSGARDELDVQPLRWTGSSVTVLADRRSQGLPN
ncbi:MAG: hypothetical protein ABIQ58_04095 [Candidatus Limnocylindrales bacterium]